MPPHPDAMDVDELAPKGLFAQNNFFVVRSDGIPEDEAQRILKSLTLHDGEANIDTYDTNDALALKGITHIVSTTTDYPDYDRACDAMIPTIKPSWIEHSLAKDKLQNPRQYSPDPRYFLSDVVACCADLPEGDADAIAGGVLAMGGLFTYKLTSQVTHIVALSIDSHMCETAVNRRLKIRIVLPHWFDDCLRLGRKIDETPYKLPNPEILNSSVDKLPYNYRQTLVNGAVDPDPASTPPPSPSTTRRAQSVFKNKKIVLAKDLGLGSHLKGILEEIIRNGGGKVVSSVPQCGMYVCKYRQGQEYQFASRTGKHVGNLAWLYYLITTDVWTSPLKRLMHYPIDPKGIPGFDKLKISLSNYTGEARTYLENLITASGAECTKTLKQDNTHLITAHVQSEKCAAAKEWGIHLVNHLWLEESYAKWTVASVSNSRFTHFPKRTNLGEVVGQTQIDREVLEKKFFPGDVEIDDNASDGAAKLPLRRTNPKPAKAAELRTPAASRFIALEKENITPSTTNSRRSKDAATTKLHELTTDIALYEKEKKRVGGVVYGGRRKTDDERVEMPRKRSVDEMADQEHIPEVEQKKKPKTGLPPIAMHLLVTGYARWKDAPKVEDSDRAKLRQLGISLVLDPARATHLAAPRIVRTVKFISAMSYAPTIVSTNFIDACLESEELEDPEAFKLVDKEQEKRLGLSLTLSKERARENRNRLLEGRSVYCLPNVNGGFETYNQIVQANGGQCMLYQGRKGTRVKSYRAGSEGADDENTDVYLISPEEGDNKKLWHQFQSMAQSSRMIPRIVTTDWLIETAMRQEILPVTKYELSS
ncbi:uncharacterized protein HMPREF1541_00523 [Cyphellophora europaea CBS 101466]|uniref:BRCT domain-containing protein n=1 Tax=Cyphellophora europaea (strain CBS 101466) TaxID=1220924 RepID=W2SEK4_CYPE1|nr:uncharacterized protein HMPREF1541_00523 [Cyphellophora europaea CBS 101466]ETN46339.1 hypothetical protein HMPREF1541_00523 [Cyphellophora europaea CBS 101466]